MRLFLAPLALAALAACGQGDTAAPPEGETALPPVADSGIDPVDCPGDQQTVFSCRAGGGKRIAVCSAGPGKAEYRYGKGAPEIRLTGGQFANVAYSGGGESQIAFDHGDTRYVVFSRMVRTGFDDGGNAPAISDGVVVLKNGAFAALEKCDDIKPIAVQLTLAEQAMPTAGALFTEETARADGGR
ncbi:MAG: hypothetical protein DI591_03620 [Citromicrobium sp.]|nr:MAG: hypothetical protein DI591_03620 [Citromicrobium sp.]